MLSLSFPRGFGLLVFVLPTYRPPRKRRSPPLLAAPRIDRDLLADAHQLARDGHETAACMTARVELERLLTLAAMTFPDYGAHWRGIHDTAAWLRSRHFIRLRTFHWIEQASDIGNSAAHGRPVDRQQVQTMLATVVALRNVLKAKGVIA